MLFQEFKRLFIKEFHGTRVHVDRRVVIHLCEPTSETPGWCEARYFDTKNRDLAGYWFPFERSETLARFLKFLRGNRLSVEWHQDTRLCNSVYFRGTITTK